MIEMENINLIKSMAIEIKLIRKELTKNSQKRWLGVKELAEYLGYSKDRIYKLKEEFFIEGVHFYKKSGKILFDRVAIDSWVVGKDQNEVDLKKQQVVDHILSSIETI